MDPVVLEPKNLETMHSDDIIMKIVKLYQDGTWNECKNFMYLSMKNALLNAMINEQESHK